GIAYDAQPRWSPDGRQITFISDRTGGDNVWVAASDGSNARPLTNGNFSSYVSPEWMPDGKYIVASRAPVAFGVPKLWMYDVEGGNGVALTRAAGPAAFYGASPTSDGRYIYYGTRNGLWEYNAEM